MEDNLEEIWKNFFENRTADLFHRFSGWYRAEVVETNDPLVDHRIRVKVPELHNKDLKPVECFWAGKAPWLGGKGSGSWSHPMIGDEVWVTFEKNHPYGPIWCGFANPTRRKQYVHQSLYADTPIPTDAEGNQSAKPNDVEKEYLPKDGRPMSVGMRDRYGTFFMLSAVGYFPSEHKEAPAEAGTDGLTKGAFQASRKPPQKNDPDNKLAVLQTKYGHTFLLGDQGYDWQSEFQGNFVNDEEFEIKRSKYLIKFFDEQKPKDRDQRRIIFWSRYGHKFEMRDVGWEQSRDGEPAESAKIADSKGRDERWVKLRTKAGMLIQAIDVGADPKSDKFISNLNQSEHGDQCDNEPTLGKDKRMLRFVTRHGAMLILDDRGSDRTAADENETPHGNGFLLRSRAGHQIQGVDRDDVNSLMMTTPKDQVFEMNAKLGYCILTTQQSGPVHTTVLKPTAAPKYFTVTGQTHVPTANAYHVLLDSKNKFLRVKTPEDQGIEVRDSDAPCGTWTEVRDNEDRALWLSKSDQHAIWRDKSGNKYILLDDQAKVIVIRNAEGPVQIFAQTDVEVIAENNICVKAGNEIGIKAGNHIAFEAAGMQYVMDGAGFGTKGSINCNTMRGFHEDIIYVPGAAQAPPAPKGAEACTPEPKQARRLRPQPFNKERGCDPTLPQKGPIPPDIFSPSPGGGGGSSSGTPPPPSSPLEPSAPSAQLPTEPTPIQDPIRTILDQPSSPNQGGVLWYGTTDKFLDIIKSDGLIIDSLVNNLNTPIIKLNAILSLAKSVDIASGKKQALLAQRRYGGKTLIIRIRAIPNAKLLIPDQADNELVNYGGNIPFDGFLEIYDIGVTELTLQPLFPQ